MLKRIQEFLTTASNIMSRTVRTVRGFRRSIFQRPTHDWGRSDYDFWRRAYFCRVKGLEISGIFIKPLVSKIAAWTLGKAPGWKLESEAAQEALDNWWDDNHAEVLRAYREALKQGDVFVVVNSDLSVTILPPDAVDPIVDEQDYSNVIGWRVTQIYQHPDQPSTKMVVTDEYYDDRRLHRREINGITQIEQTYPNLLGRLPIIHIANQPQSGEMFGHAEAEALVEVLQRYGEIFEAAIEGNKTQGRPTPVLTFETIQDLDKFWDDNATRQSMTLPDGTTETNSVLDVDLTQLLTVSGATFDYKAPGSFSADTAKLLELMFYLILEHTELPEFVMGNAISSSKASAEAQLPIFLEFIEGRRGDIKVWLTEIAEVALGYLALITPGVAVETPALQWEELDQADGSLTLQSIQWAFAEGLLDRKTALALLPVTVEDPDSVLDAAQKEADARAARFPENALDENQFDAALKAEIESLEID